MNKSIKISGLLTALLLACGGVQAAGLGKLSVQSALGQPLRAEIELLSVTKDELPGVSARVAAQELFRQARIERSGALSALEFEVAQRANGQPVLRISSPTPMSDPFLDMLIELNWSTGRVIREYTILLDPPAEGRATTQPAAAKTVVPASTTPAKEGAAAETPKPVQEAAKPAAKPAPERYGPVKSGETLRSIASRVKNPDVTLEQMMAGLYLTNKGAFIDSNMNLLKKGTVLNVPSTEAAHRQNSPSQATRMVRNHLEEWHAYRSKVAQVAGEAPETKPEGQAAAGKIMPKVEDKTPVPAVPKDVLKLSKGEPAAAGKPDAKTQERLQALEEELAAKTRALQESNDRVSQLERAVQDMQKLLALKSQEAAKPEAAPAPAPTPVEPAQPAAPEPAPVQAAKPAPAPVTPLPPAAKEEEESWFTTFLKNPIYIGGLVAAGLLSGLLWMMMVGSRRRQGLNKFEDSIMTGGEFKSSAVFNTGGTAATAGATSTGGSMLLTDFSRLGLGAIDTHEVDPIAEAEVYMAYGRDAQAEEILKEALEKDSSRHEVSLKLLEIYAARKDPLAFETTASELYAGLGGQDTPIWQRAAEMGRSIDPENPLYRMAHGTALAAEPSVSEAPQARAAEAAPEDMGMEFVSPVTSPAAVATAPEAQADRGMDLEFTSPILEPELQPAAPGAPLEFETAPALATEEAQPVDELSMEFEPVATDLAQAEVPELAIDLEAMEELPEAEEVPEFRIEAEVPESQLEEFAPPSESIELELPTAEAEAAALPDLDFSSIDLELAPEAPAQEQAEAIAEIEFEPQPAEAEAMAAPAAEQAPDSGIDPTLWEEVNTKLDLARAYLEMGDREGAREILQEVTQEGDRTQKAEANKLLAEAG